MLKKILVGGLVLIMVGSVVAGAMALFAPSEEDCARTETRAQGQGFGQGAQGDGQRRGAEGSQAGARGEGQGQGIGRDQGQAQVQRQGFGRDQGQAQGQGQQDQGQQGQGQGQGQQGQGQGSGRALDSETTAAPAEGDVIEGVVLETEDLVLETASGKKVQIGLGPGFYRESKGFVLQSGENVRVSGYWEDDEFKAAQVENLDTGESIVLRDANGRPMWAGQGRGKNRNS